MAKYLKCYLKYSHVIRTFEMTLNEHFPLKGKTRACTLTVIFGVFKEHHLENKNSDLFNTWKNTQTKHIKV